MGQDTFLPRSISETQLKPSTIHRPRSNYTAKLSKSKSSLRRKSPIVKATSETFIAHKIKQSKVRSLTRLNKLLESLPNSLPVYQPQLSLSPTKEPLENRERPNGHLAKSLKVLKDLVEIRKSNFDMVENLQPCLLDQVIELLKHRPEETSPRPTDPCSLCGCCCRQVGVVKVLNSISLSADDKCTVCGGVGASSGICRQCQMYPQPSKDGTLNLLLKVTPLFTEPSPKYSPLRSRVRGLASLTVRRSTTPLNAQDSARGGICRVTINDSSVDLVGQGPHIVKLQMSRVARPSATTTPTFSKKESAHLSSISPGKGILSAAEVSFSHTQFSTIDNEQTFTDPSKRLTELTIAIHSIKGKAWTIYSLLKPPQELPNISSRDKKAEVCQKLAGQYVKYTHSLLKMTGSLSSELALALNLVFDGMLMLIDYSLAREVG